MYALRKDEKVGGTCFRYRVRVKSFRSSDAMNKFLASQYDNRWSVMKNPVKSGVYVERGITGELLNVKDLDPSVLAHM